MSQSIETEQQTPALSPVLINLFKGVLYRAEQPDVWQSLLRLHTQVRDHVAPFGLELHLDESEGYAYLKQIDPSEEENELPRLVSRRPLGYHVSLLIALLRKKLIEHDTAGGDYRLIVTRDEIADMVRLFLPDTADEVRFMRRIDRDINQIASLGFLRKMKGQAGRLEVQRILATFVDAQWLSDFEARLAEYRQHADGEGDS